MTRHLPKVVWGVALALALASGSAGPARAQTTFLKGQNVQPVYEGWEKNPDGTFAMVFGYLNRNYGEEPFVPIGSDNLFAPGPQDRGQPTYFDTRRQSFIFKVIVPSDWGNKELTWTINHNGRSGTATGNLLPTWAIDEGVWRANRGAGINGRTADDYTSNRPPTAQIVGPATVRARVGETITLVATATDDGRPGPRPKKAGGGGGEGGSMSKVVISNPDLPTFGGDRSGAASGTGGPTDQNIVQVNTAYETGVGVTWRHYRGPGKVAFLPRAVPLKTGAMATTTIRFNEPGTHVIRAVADDSIYTSGADVTVIVEAADSRK